MSGRQIRIGGDEITHHKGIFAILIFGHFISIEGYLLMPLCGHIDAGFRTGCYSFSVATEFPMQYHVVHRGKELLVENVDGAGLKVRSGPEVLVIILHLGSGRMRLAVGGNEAVAVEVVVGSGITSEVATICKDLVTSLARAADGLVHEVPDKAALILGLCTYGIPVLLETTHGIAHGMRIFALDERTGSAGGLAIGMAPVYTGIHGTHDVGGISVAGTFVMHGA